MAVHSARRLLLEAAGEGCECSVGFDAKPRRSSASRLQRHV